LRAARAFAWCIKVQSGFSCLSEQAFTALFFFLHVVLLLHPEPERFLEQQLLAFSSLLGICVAAGYAASRIAGW
jgi:hypothetical protein